MEKDSDFLNKTLELTGLPPQFFQQHRENYKKSISELPDAKNSIVVLQGGSEIARYDTDGPFYHFQQEANFYYLTGVRDPDCYAIFEAETGEVTVYIKLATDDRSKIIMTVPTLDELSEKYKIQFKHVTCMYEDIKQRNPEKIHLLCGVNSDSGLNIHTAKLTFPDDMKSDFEAKINTNEIYYETLAETRTVKTKDEIRLLQHCNNATIEGHKEVAKLIKPGMLERDAENIFVNLMREKYYARIWAYPCICGAGEASATLHYQKNDITINDGDFLLLDMGVRLGGYIADITSTIPVNGKFTEKQKQIYDIVLTANRTVMHQLRAGISWTDMQLEAERVILEGLKGLRILNDFDINEMRDNRVAFYFMPHGLGHFIGIEVHDVGGYLSFTPKRHEKIGMKSMRTARVLKDGNCITVEPGVYFIRSLIDKAYADESLSKYFNKEVLEGYMKLGGVRIEDDVVITETGFVNLTAGLPRETEDIENLMKK
jgi:Xaa-Pro dipeptidase